MAAPIGSKNESPSSKIDSQNDLHGKSDQSGSTNIKSELLSLKIIIIWTV